MNSNRPYFSFVRRLMLILVVLLGLALVIPGVPAHADSIDVSCDSDELRSVIDYVNGNSVADTVSLSAGCTYTMPDQAGTDPDYLNIADDNGTVTTIEGNGATVTVTGATPVIEVWGNADAVINNLHIVGGNTEFFGGNLFTDTGSTLSLTNSTLSGGTAAQGGGIYVRGVSATLTNVTISNGDAVATGSHPIGSNGGRGGGVFVENGSTLTINNSTISGNTAADDGGGIFVNGTGVLNLNNSTVSGNTAVNEGGGIAVDGTANVVASTFSGNSANNGGGLATGNSLTVTNSTVSGNTATVAGGGLYSDAPTNVYNSTFSANGAANGGNLRQNSAPLGIYNTIAANSAGGGDCSGPGPTLFYSLVEDGGCSVAPGVNGNKNGDPNLGPLTNNGGPTLTHALQTGSSAINAGDNSLIPGGVTTDQTGAARIADVTVDMGAVEGLGAAVVPQVTISPAIASLTEGGSTTLTVTRTGATGTALTVSFTTGGTAPGADFTAGDGSGTVTIPIGSATANLTISTNDNYVDDGFRTVIVTLSDGAAYDLGATTSSTVTIDDNDTAGVTVTPTSGLVTTEAGGTATFTVVLDSQPTADVTIAVVSDDTTEGTAAPTPLTFTAANWNTPQTVTVTGQDDAVDDGTTPYIITLTATSSDSLYNGIVISSVSASNSDDDTAGVTVSLTSGLGTTEAGGTDSFTVVLDSQPTADVTVDVSSSDTSEGSVSPTSLTFTTANWNSPQTVIVTGQDDDVDDGDVAYNINLTATSSDSLYNGIVISSVSASNTDDDTAGVTVTPTSGLVTTEAGGTATFTVVLDSQPTADVTIAVVSDDTTEGTAAPTPLTFTAADWDTPQTVTVTGQDDAISDGNVPYHIELTATSGDSKYNGISVPSVGVTNNDDADAAGVTVTPTSGLVTTEAGGTATFTVVLESQPTADVTITVVSSDTTEGTVSPTPLTFTAANWNTPQTVTVTGVDDFVDDGDVAYSINLSATSTDGSYNGIPVSSVGVSNTDNDTAGVTVTPTTGLVTTEAGGTASFTVVLNTQPTADVSISVASSDTSEGTVSPTTLTFTAANWNSAQTVNVTGVNDGMDDGDVGYLVTMFPSSSDTLYSSVSVSSVSVTNTDDDTAGVTVTPPTGLTTTEAGGTATFTVVLNSQPTADVTVDVSSSDTSEGTVSPTSLTFTAANWNSPQTVTVTGVDDSVADGNVNYSVILQVSSSDSFYNGNPPAVGVTNTDNDSPGVAVTPTSGLVTTEAGGTASFTVVLNSEPTADVTIAVSSSNTAEGTVAPTSVTFTTANWNIAQTVTVTGQDDGVADGNIGYNIVLGAASSSDTNYNGLDPADVSVTNTDNDVPGLTAAPSSFSRSEGGAASYQLSLNTVPSAVPVSVSISFDDTQLTVNGSTSPVVIDLSDTTPVTVNVAVLANVTLNSTRNVTITNAVSASTASEYPVGMSSNVTVTIVEGQPPASPDVPEAPPVPPATDNNFVSDSVLRVSVPDSIRTIVRARILVQNGGYMQYLGSPMYDSGNIGHQGVLDLGVLQAVDIFSSDGRTSFGADVVVCLKGTGTLIWFPASEAPRNPRVVDSYTVPEFPGFTCTTITEPGMLVLTQRSPQ